MRDDEHGEGVAYLTGDVARLAERSEATIRQDAARGRLRASLRTPRGVNIYLAADVAAYLAARRGAPA